MKDAVTKPRRLWIAVLMAALCMGLGHAYVGRMRVAILIQVVTNAVGVALLGLAALTDQSLVGTTILLAALLAAAYAAQIVWAARIALAAGSGFVLRKSNHLAVYVLFVVMARLLSPGPWVKSEVAEAFRNTSGSNLPTLSVGDQVLVSKLGSRNSQPQRGDLVVFRAPGTGNTYLKRVVALAGDRLAIVGGTVAVEEQLVTTTPRGRRSYQDHDRQTDRLYDFEANAHEECLVSKCYTVITDTEAPSPDFEAMTVPAGHFFVVGDNRDHSLDSRSFGPVPLDSLVGRATEIWWSSDSSAIHLERIGTRL